MFVFFTEFPIPHRSAEELNFPAVLQLLLTDEPVYQTLSSVVVVASHLISTLLRGEGNCSWLSLLTQIYALQALLKRSVYNQAILEKKSLHLKE
jgi:hypothetical protein